MDPFLYHRSFIPAAVEEVYLDTATTGPFHRRVLRSLYRFYGLRYRQGASQLDYQDWLAKAHRVRSLLASLLAVQEEEIAFTPNASTGINLAAHLIPFQAGDEVLIPDLSFPSSFYAFQNLASQGVVIRWIKSNAGAVSTKDLYQAVTQKTKAISLSQVEFASGFRHELEAIGSFCQEQGIYLVVDATQGVGALSLDVKKACIPFLAFSPYKWLCAPLGLGVFYCQRDLMEGARPGAVGWLGVKDPFAFSQELDLSMTGRRFEPGGLNYGAIQALGEAVSIHLELGVEEIEKRIVSLVAYLIPRLLEQGVSILGPYPIKNRSGILYLLLEPWQIQQIQKVFSQEGIRVHYGEDRIRLGIHYFNTIQDLDFFLETLETVL